MQIVHGDALKVNMRKAVADLIGSHGKRVGAERVKVIANLPYYITTEILKILLPLGSQVSELFLMLQVCEYVEAPGKALFTKAFGVG